MIVPGEAVELAAHEGPYRLTTREGESISGGAIVIATGVRYRKLGVPGLARLEGQSVFYAATQAEAQLCRGEPVVVVGGGNSAGQATMFLSQYGPRMSLVVREHDLGASMSRYLADRIERSSTVDVLPHCEVREVVGEEELEAVIVEDTETGERRRLDARALFVFIGAEPHTEWLCDQIALDDGGYVRTGEDAAASVPDYAGQAAGRSPLMLETSLPGVFAAGDVRSGSTQRVAAAVGDGAIAVRLAHASRWLPSRSLHRGLVADDESREDFGMQDTRVSTP
ncbi:MAG TPA: NAD(P)/FAD-dependent oxidoreductase [Solirubrobacteraceae bacterium]